MFNHCNVGVPSNWTFTLTLLPACAKFKVPDSHVVKLGGVVLTGHDVSTPCSATWVLTVVVMGSGTLCAMLGAATAPGARA